MLQSSVCTPHGFTVKLADFGMARHITGPHTLNVQGTYTHINPEVLAGGDVSTVCSFMPVPLFSRQLLCAKEVQVDNTIYDALDRLRCLKRLTIL